MDDGYLFAKTREEAEELLDKIIEFCRQRGLIINRRKTKIIKLTQGFKFLKVRYRLLSTGKIIKKLTRKNLTKTRRKLKKLAKFYYAGKMALEDIKNAYGSWQGYALRRGSKLSYRNMNKLFEDLFHVPAPKCVIRKKRSAYR